MSIDVPEGDDDKDSSSDEDDIKDSFKEFIKTEIDN